jgi:hypothetical protein
VQVATFACLQHTISQVGQVQATVEANGEALLRQITDAQAAIEARVSAAEARLAGDVRAARDDVAEARAEWRAQYFDLVLLLSTPQGLREDFPQSPGSGGK